ncbi:MAG: hypothetical protein JJ979_11980 [Roseibium sp.]|nr:hypothetical protein [Roseibium sp.]
MTSAHSQLTLDELLLLYFILGKAAKERPIGTDGLPDFLNSSPATTARRLKKLQDEGYLKRYRKGKSYCYVPTSSALYHQYFTPEGFDYLDEGVQAVHQAIRKLEDL